MVFHKLLFTASKRKSQDSSGRPNTNKINFDSVSVAILSRHFSPLPSRIKSPTELLDVIGYPQQSPRHQMRRSSSFSPVSTNTATQDAPDINFTPIVRHKMNETQSSSSNNTATFGTLRITNGVDSSQEQPAGKDIHNLKQYNEAMLLETSREDKILVEKSSTHYFKITDSETDINMELYKIYRKLLEIEHERELWNKRLDEHMEEMRNLLREHQLEMNELKRQNSKMTVTDMVNNDRASINTNMTHDSSNSASSSYQLSATPITLPLHANSYSQASGSDKRASSLSLAERHFRKTNNAAVANTDVDTNATTNHSHSKKKKKKKKDRESWPIMNAQDKDVYYYYEYYNDNNADDPYHYSIDSIYYNNPTANFSISKRKVYPYSSNVYPSVAM